MPLHVCENCFVIALVAFIFTTVCSASEAKAERGTGLQPTLRSPMAPGERPAAMAEHLQAFVVE